MYKEIVKKRKQKTELKNIKKRLNMINCGIEEYKYFSKTNEENFTNLIKDGIRDDIKAIKEHLERLSKCR